MCTYIYIYIHTCIHTHTTVDLFGGGVRPSPFEFYVASLRLWVPTHRIQQQTIQFGTETLDLFGVAESNLWEPTVLEKAVAFRAQVLDRVVEVPPIGLLRGRLLIIIMFIDVHVYLSLSIYIYTYVYIYIYIYIYMCMYVCMYVHIYIYIYIYAQSPYEEFGFRGAWLTQTLNSQGWEFSCPLNLIVSLLESLTQGLLTGKLLVGGLGVVWTDTWTCSCPRSQTTACLQSGLGQAASMAAYLPKIRKNGTCKLGKWKPSLKLGPCIHKLGKMGHVSTSSENGTCTADGPVPLGRRTLLPLSPPPVGKPQPSAPSAEAVLYYTKLSICDLTLCHIMLYYIIV